MADKSDWALVREARRNEVIQTRNAALQAAIDHIIPMWGKCDESRRAFLSDLDTAKKLQKRVFDDVVEDFGEDVVQPIWHANLDAVFPERFRRLEQALNTLPSALVPLISGDTTKSANENPDSLGTRHSSMGQTSETLTDHTAVDKASPNGPSTIQESRESGEQNSNCITIDQSPQAMRTRSTSFQREQSTSNQNKRSADAERVDLTVKRPRKAPGSYALPGYDDLVDPPFPRTTTEPEMAGLHWAFEFPSVGPGWFVLYCNEDPSEAHQFPGNPWLHERAVGHFLNPKKKCHEASIAASYTKEEILEKFGYLVVGMTDDEIRASNQRIEDETSAKKPRKKKQKSSASFSKAQAFYEDYEGSHKHTAEGSSTDSQYPIVTSDVQEQPLRTDYGYFWSTLGQPS